MSETVLSAGTFDDDWETRNVAVPSADGSGVVLMVQTRLHEGDRWHVNSGGVESLTWPEIRKLAAMDPDRPSTPQLESDADYLRSFGSGGAGIPKQDRMRLMDIAGRIDNLLEALDPEKTDG